MWGNLLRPFVLVRLGLTACAVVGVVVAFVVALRHLRDTGLPPGDPRRIASERRLELAQAMLTVSFFAAMLGPLVTVLGASQAHDEIRGAMCAYGVLASTEHGQAAVLSGLFASLGCAAFLGVAALDRALDDTRLVRRKTLAAMALLPMILLDAALAIAFVGELDFGVVATCCSSGAEGPASGPASAAASDGWFAAAALLGTLAIGAAVASVRAGSRLLSVVFGVASVAWLPATFVGAATVTAPHVFGASAHRCAYCLLEPAGHHLGYVLFGAAFVVAALGAATLAVTRERDVAPVEAARLERTLARLALAPALLALAALVGPVLAFWLEAGTFLVPPW